MTTVVKATTKRGKNLINSASVYEGYKLSDVYDSYSESKESAYNYCWEKYCNTPQASDFGICSHNTFQFSVSWNGTYIDTETGEAFEAVFLETANNSYVII